MAQARRNDPTRSQSKSFSIDTVAAISATTTVWAWKVGAQRTFKLERAVINVSATYAADTTNFYTIQIKDGSTVLASWSTQTSAQGALTANTPADLILNTTDANLAAAGGDTLTVVCTKSAAAANFPTFNLHPEGQYY